MKNKMIYLLIAIIFNTYIYATQLEILQKHNEYIKNQMKELEIKKDKEWSKLTYLKLEEELFLSEFNIIKEKKIELKENFNNQIELKKIGETRQVLNNKLKEYQENLKIMEKNKNIISFIEIETMKYNISVIKEKILENESDLIYFKNRDKEIKKIEDEKMKKNDELNKEKYEFEKSILNREIEILKLENNGAEVIKNKEIEIQVLDLQYKEDQKQIKKDKENNEKELKKYTAKLDLVEKEIKLKKIEKEMQLKKFQAGLAKKTEFFEKDMECLEKELERYEYESRIKYINMELEE